MADPMVRLELASPPPVSAPVQPVASPPAPGPVTPTEPTQAGTRPATDDEVRRLAVMVARGCLDDGRMYAHYLERDYNVVWDGPILEILAEDDGKRWVLASDDELSETAEFVAPLMPMEPVAAAPVKPLATLDAPTLAQRSASRFAILEDHAWIDLQRLSLERAVATGNQGQIARLEKILEPIDKLIAELDAT